MTNPIFAATRPHVLVVDDHLDSADTLACLLPLIVDCTAHVAHSGAQALALADVIRPRIVILDITMPGMGGCEVARRLRALPWARGLQIVTLSGWDDHDTRCCGTAANIDFHLTKPVTIDALLEALAFCRSDES